MNGSAAFYQVAVALIPAILFGGATLEVRRKQERESPTARRKIAVRALLIAIFIGGLAAEVVAISGAIEPRSVGAWGERGLAFTVMAGSGGLAIWMLAPAVADGDGFHDLQVVAAVAVVLACGVGGVLAIEWSLNRAKDNEAFGAAEGVRLEAARELRAAEGNDFEARANLLLLAGTTKRSGSAVSMVVDALRGMEDSAYRPVRQDVSAANRELLTHQAFGYISKVDHHLRSEFRTGLTGLDDSEHLLLVLAERRMISAAKLVMTTALTKTAAHEEIETLCTVDAYVGTC